jgi:hypothetical protein
LVSRRRAERRKGGKAERREERPRKAKRITVGWVAEIKREIAQKRKTDREGDVRLEQFLGKPKKKMKKKKKAEERRRRRSEGEQ